MKQLRLEFQSNADNTGLQTFTQIKRTANTALYVRTRNGRRKRGKRRAGSEVPVVHSYEAFKIKVVKAGSKLPGGNVVAEDYEAYPGKSAFGRYAYSCKTLERAELRYNELLQSQEIADDGEIDNDEYDDVNNKDTKNPAVKGKRGRKAKDRSSLKIPKDKFTIKQLELLNPDVSFAFLYQHVRGLLNIEFKIVESLTGKRGKPTIVYAPIDLDSEKSNS